MTFQVENQFSEDPDHAGNLLGSVSDNTIWNRLLALTRPRMTGGRHWNCRHRSRSDHRYMIELPPGSCLESLPLEQTIVSKWGTFPVHSESQQRRPTASGADLSDPDRPGAGSAGSTSTRFAGFARLCPVLSDLADVQIDFRHSPPLDKKTRCRRHPVTCRVARSRVSHECCLRAGATGLFSLRRRSSGRRGLCSLRGHAPLTGWRPLQSGC